MNGVPVARQNRDRPRRVARRESSPDASTKKKGTAVLAVPLSYVGILYAR